MDIIRHTIEVSGAGLYVEERGTGEPLVLLHGMAGTSGDWRHVFDLDALARRLPNIRRRNGRACERCTRTATSRSRASGIYRADSQRTRAT
jgi:hypothetical protein